MAALIDCPPSVLKSAVRPPDRPLAWIGNDRLLLNDTTVTGLRRKVIASKSDAIDQDPYLEEVFKEASRARVHWWTVTMPNGFVYLWMIWKKAG